MREPHDPEGLSAYVENEAQVGEGREPDHVPLISYPTVEAAATARERFEELESTWDRSPHFQSLNGTWDFRWVPRPADLPSIADGDWDEIEVPGVWQTQGYGRAIYRNIPLTWHEVPETDEEPAPPNVPFSWNPVGTYRRTFEVPEAWDGRDVRLHFEAAKSGLFVWVNGEPLGYDQGSTTPSEFDVTDHLVDGENTVTAQLVRFTDASYLETIDMIRTSGLFRSVYLYAKPETAAEDLFVRPELGPEPGEGPARVLADVDVVGPSADVTVRGILHDSDGDTVATDAAPVPSGPPSGRAAPDHPGAPRGRGVTLDLEVEDPALWSAERPALYELVVAVERDGETVEAVRETVGLREVGFGDGPVTVNGDPIEFRGVNHHEHDPERGRTLPIERLREDFELMKRHNVNSIRASHYPNDPTAYQLAAEYGIYVVDEVNAETHWDLEFVNRFSEFHEAFRERFRRMVQRNKNAPAIIGWSTGNEAGTGLPHADMASYARAVDGTRFVMHQGDDRGAVAREVDGMSGSAGFTDVLGPRYPDLEDLEDVLDVDDRPLVLGEYAHALGNSGGLLEAYWELFRSDEQFQGGFVWEWNNHTLARTAERDGETVAVDWYDGDRFLLDGLVFADRRTMPDLDALKAVHQPVGVEAVDLAAGRLRLENRHVATDLAERDLRWRVAVDGETVQSGALDASVPPGESATVEVPLERPELAPGSEARLHVSVHLPEATDWADAGHEVARADLALPFEATSATTDAGGSRSGAVGLGESGGTVQVTAGDVEWTLDRASGTLAGCVLDGDSLLERGPLFDAWRAPILNESRLIDHWGEAAEPDWNAAGLAALEHAVESVTVEAGDGEATVAVEGVARGANGAAFATRYNYRFAADGTCRVAVTAEPNGTLVDRIDTWLPRVGVELAVPERCSEVTWYGRGPGETYPDRRAAGSVDRHAARAEDLWVDYLPPQASGQLTDVRWLALRDGDGPGLAALAPEPLHAAVEPYANVEAADAPRDLAGDGTVGLHLDAAVTGVGGTPRDPLERYQVQPEPVSFAVALRPVAAGEDPTPAWRRLAGE